MVDTLVSDYAEVLRNISIVASEECLNSGMIDGVPIRKLFVSNLAARTTFKDIRNYFSTHYGNIENCYLHRDGTNTNYAFVTFSNVEDAMIAMEDGSRKQIRLHNRDLRVMSANSWHQPDSIEQRLYYTAKEFNKASDKKAADDQYTQECLQNDADSVSIHTLNNDCLRHIFMFLPIVDRIRIERVCKRWRALSYESWCTMKSLDLAPTICNPVHIGMTHTVTLRKILLRCGRFLTKINLSDPIHCFTPSTLTIIGKLCPNLTNIDISGLAACSSGIKTLAYNCKNITRFSLGPSIFNLDHDLRNFFKTHQNLEYFAVTGNSFSGKCLSYLPARTIHTIILKRCPYIQDSHLSAALKRLENLSHLTIANEINCITEYTSEVISKRTNLRVLELRGFFPLVRKIDVSFFTHLVNLQVLKTVQNDKMSDELLVNMAVHCQQLTCIDITGCGDNVTDIGITAIATLPKLEKLSINYVISVTDNGLRNIHNLTEFKCRRCLSISDDGISTIIKSSPQLRLLDLSGCWNITDDTLKVAKQTCNSRSSNVMLKMIIGGTFLSLSICPVSAKYEELCPFLQTVNVDFSEE